MTSRLPTLVSYERKYDKQIFVDVGIEQRTADALIVAKCRWELLLPVIVRALLSWDD